MAELTYEVEKTCPVCEGTVMVTKVRSRLTMVKQDSDFCTYYQGISPYYYNVWVCPHCGFAAPEADFGGFVHDKVKKFLAGKKVNIDFSGVRTRDQAFNTYRLAIFYGEMAGIQASKLAALYLRLGWLYREGDQPEDEQAALAKAAEQFEKAMIYERFPIAGMSEVQLTYLLGELFRRSGKLDEALLFYNRVVSNPQAKMEKKILEMARDAWQDTRDLKKHQAVSAE